MTNLKLAFVGEPAFLFTPRSSVSPVVKVLYGSPSKVMADREQPAFGYPADPRSKNESHPDGLPSRPASGRRLFRRKASRRPTPRRRDY